MEINISKLDDLFDLLNRHDIREFKYNGLEVVFSDSLPTVTEIHRTVEKTPINEEAYKEFLAKVSNTAHISDDDILLDPYAGLDQFDKKD